MMIQILDVLLTYFIVMNWWFLFKAKYLEALTVGTWKNNAKIPFSRFVNHSNFYINFFLSNLMLFVVTLFMFRPEADGTQGPFNLTDLIGYNIYFWAVLNIFFFWTMKQINFSNFSMFKLEYTFVIVNIFFFFTVLMICDNLYSFLLVLEICSYLFFYKLIMIPTFSTRNFSTRRQLSMFYSLLFYHYWVSTFSTFLYFFFFTFLIHKYGSVSFAILTYMCGGLQSQTEEFFFNFFIVIFVMCFCLKLGFSPFHFFKLGVYEGLGFQYLLFYTTYYFIGFFAVFSILYFKLIVPCSAVLSQYLVWIVLFWFLLLASSISSNNSLRHFFLLSAVINLLNLFLILLLWLF